MVKTGRARLWGDQFTALRAAVARVFPGRGQDYPAWPEAPHMAAGAERAPPGWWIAATAPFGLAAWSALGWLLFAL